MNWKRAASVRLLIAAVESVHGTLRRLFIVPVTGERHAHLVGVLTGSFLIAAIAVPRIRRLGASTFRKQLLAGLCRAVLTFIFEACLGSALGYAPGRILADCNFSARGFMGFGLLFMLLAPMLAARVRSVR